MSGAIQKKSRRSKNNQEKKPLKIGMGGNQEGKAPGRGRPVKYPRPLTCSHGNRNEHKNGVCYQCSSNLNNQKKRILNLGDKREELQNIHGGDGRKHPSLFHQQSQTELKGIILTIIAREVAC
jgi:hypothetical protein